MSSITGIPTTRVSDLYVRERLLAQVQQDQLAMFRSQTMLSTGHRFQVPSEDPVASIQVINLQSLLERKAQVRANLNTNLGFLSATDAALSQVSQIMADVRATALGVVGTIATDVQRRAAADQVRQALRQLVDTGNQSFRGRYLFAGSVSGVRPFELGGTTVRYVGNEDYLSSYADIDLMFNTNLTGSEVFGAISQAVLGTTTFIPALRPNVPLADLRDGQGISRGSIEILVNTRSYLVDLSKASTVEDVALLIHHHTRGAVKAWVGAEGLVLEGSGNLVVREVAGGRTASDLGILTETTPGTRIVGQPLRPILKPTTLLADLLGTRASAAIVLDGLDNDFIVEAGRNGADLNGVQIRLVDDGSVINPHADETVVYDAAGSPPTLTIKIASGVSTAADVVNAFSKCYDPAAMPFTARLDPQDEKRAGQGQVFATPIGETAGVTSGGSGYCLDRDSGLQIVNGGSTYVIRFADANTVEDLLNKLNGSEAGLLAEINATRRGINLRSRISGADFAVGENGGRTAADLGIRSLTEDTKLSDLNFGRGIHSSAEGGASQPVDFTIKRKDGVEFDVNLENASTIKDVLDLINNNPENCRTGVKVRAQLAAYGNGIELVDDGPGPGTLTVIRSPTSTAAIELGLVPPGRETSQSPVDTTIGRAEVLSANPDSSLVISARTPGDWASSIHVLFKDTGTESVAYNPDTHQLLFTYESGVTTAARLKQLLEQDPAAGGLFSASYPAADPPGTGSGIFAPLSSDVPMAIVSTQVWTGTDPNPLETESMFTALLRLEHALRVDDVLEVERAIELLDRSVTEMNFSRAAIGVQQQGLDMLKYRLEDEHTELRSELSLEYDADVVEVVANLATQQAVFEAAMRTMAQVYNMTLLNYL